jgi:L-fuculose-phosphate aldolase
MKTVVSLRDIEDLLHKGGNLNSLPQDAIYTPSARDFLRDQQNGRGAKPSCPAPAKCAAAAPVANPTSDAEIQAFFNSPEIQVLKEEICGIGKRLWAREYVDGNGGNISIRVRDNLVLCTPTLVSKGFMKPEDLCFVDMEGNQKAGVKKRTSEVLMHLQIMKAQPKAKSVVHCHPPHATAFAIAGIRPPTCMIPEIEVMIGVVPIAEYRTPGTPEMGKLIADLVGQHNTVLMANHGVVSWSHSVEDAYFKMEILEAYCRTVVVASQLGVETKTFSPTHLKDLLKIKQTLGIPDPRIGLKECELCDNSEWRPGVSCAVPNKSEAPAASDADAEKLVQTVTEQILARMNG